MSTKFHAYSFKDPRVAKSKRESNNKIHAILNFFFIYIYIIIYI